MITIHKPMFNFKKQRAVGLAAWRVANEGVITTVRISYRTKDGERLYPNDLCMASSQIGSYPVEYINDNTAIYIVPIDDFKVVENEKNSNQKNLKENCETSPRLF
jgi:hypothetical protein